MLKTLLQICNLPQFSRFRFKKTKVVAQFYQQKNKKQTKKKNSR